MLNKYYRGNAEYGMGTGHERILIHDRQGQSMVELALVLPLFVLFIIGIFDLGRAFFAYIAITNAAREGARSYTFSPNFTTTDNIKTAVKYEIGTNTLINLDKLQSIQIQCGNSYTDVSADDAALKACPAGQPIRVTVTYTQELILSVIFSQPLTIKKSAEMMVPWTQ